MVAMVVFSILTGAADALAPLASGGFIDDVYIDGLNGRNGFSILSGVKSSDFCGRSVSGAGDINGDGIDDVIVGVPGTDPGGPMSGGCYVVFGSTQGFPTNLNSLTLSGSNGFRIAGAAAHDWCGCSVSGAGDVDGDGIADVILGAQYADVSGEASGACYVVFGSTQGFPSDLAVARLDGTNGFRISGAAAYHYLGGSVSGAGDVNGDGLDDVIVGAWGASPNGPFSGASYIVFGSTQRFASNLDVGALDGRDGFRLSGAAAYDYSGAAVSGAGDVNGDGSADVVIGAAYADPGGIASGAAYVVFGTAAGFASDVELSALDGSNGFRISGSAPGDHFGHSVSGAGDINNDGVGDVIIGAPMAANGASYIVGACYFVFGATTGFGPRLAAEDLDGTNGFRIIGINESRGFGTSVSDAADFNRDGIADAIVSQSDSEAWVIYGTTGRLAGFSIKARYGENFGFSVSGAGDVNHDGIPDAIIGAPRNSIYGNSWEGSAYVVFVKVRFPQGDGDGDGDADYVQGDVDGDRDADLWVEGKGGVSTILVEGHSMAGTGAWSLALERKERGAAVNDFDGDRVSDIVVQRRKTIAVCAGSDMSRMPPVALPKGCKVEGSGDFDADGAPDLLVSAKESWGLLAGPDFTEPVTGVAPPAGGRKQRYAYMNGEFVPMAKGQVADGDFARIWVDVVVLQKKGELSGSVIGPLPKRQRVFGPR